MIRGTTPTHIFNLPIDTNLISSLIITYKQNDEIVLTKELDACSLGERSISLKLTQEESLLFDCTGNGYAKVQIKVLTQSGDVLSSRVSFVKVEECLNDEVLE